jgi:hypothetical protein
MPQFKSFKFVVINQLCDRLAAGEITEAVFTRLCEKYEDHVTFIATQPTIVKDGARFKTFEAGPGSCRMRVA